LSSKSVLNANGADNRGKPWTLVPRSKGSPRSSRRRLPTKISPLWDLSTRSVRAFSPLGGPIVEGRAAIQATIQRMVEAGIRALDLQAIDVIEAGDLVIEIGRTTATIQPPGAKSLILLLVGKRTLTKQGKSIVVWRRQKDGTLKIVADTFNSD
jgi:ketosteroid isomerase-like protein